MRSQSHTTWISKIAEHVDAWRKAKKMSQASVVDEIVKTHDAIGGPVATGIAFEGNSDEFNRMHANMQRVYRWLDDRSKDTNLLPANFLPSVLAAMPADVRMSCLNEMLAPLGLVVRGAEQSEGELASATAHLVKIARETSEAQSAVASLIDGATHAELNQADRELAEAEEAIRAARADVRKQISAQVH